MRLCGHSLPRRRHCPAKENAWENGERKGSDSEHYSEQLFFTPFLVFRLLTVTVTILQRRLEWKYR